MPALPAVPALLKTARHRLEWLVLSAAERSVPHLDRRAVLALARVFGTLAYRLDYRGRTTAHQNLRAAFGPGLGDAGCARIARASYRNMARTAFDLFWISALDRTTWHEHMRREIRGGGEPMTDPLAPSVLVTAHFGNFEWLAQAWGFAGQPLLIIAQDFKNPLLTPIFSRLRSVSGNQIIPQNRAVIRLMRHLKGGGRTAFLTDLTVKPSGAATVIRCFGLATCVTTTHAELAARTGLPLVPCYGLPEPDGRYTMVAESAIRTDGLTVQQVVQRCWDVYEQAIRQRPELWMWMYKHWRYIPPRSHGEYPPYANRSKRFDALCAKSLPATSP
ncbi:N/A [soil metagenome]